MHDDLHRAAGHLISILIGAQRLNVEISKYCMYDHILQTSSDSRGETANGL
jgi:hypothetical protein